MISIQKAVHIWCTQLDESKVNIYPWNHHHSLWLQHKYIHHLQKFHPLNISWRKWKVAYKGCAFRVLWRQAILPVWRLIIKWRWGENIPNERDCFMYCKDTVAFNKRKLENFRREQHLPTVIAMVISTHPGHWLSDYHVPRTKPRIPQVLFYKSPKEYVLICPFTNKNT